MNLKLVMQVFSLMPIKKYLALDVGANTGQWYKQAKDLCFPDSRIISVEGNIHCMCDLLKNNPHSVNVLFSRGRRL